MWRDAGAEVDATGCASPASCSWRWSPRNPSRFTVHARNPERSTEIGGNKVAFAPTYGSPFVYDFNNERRYGTLADLHQFHQLAYLAPAMHNTGAVVCEPVDIADPQAPSAHHLQRDQAFRQTVHGAGDRARARRGRGAHGRAWCSATTFVDAEHGDDLAGQLQLAAGVGRDHARRAQGLCPRQPGR